MATLTDSHTYLDLLAEFPPRRITNAEELTATAARVDSIIDRAPLSADEEDYIFTLGMLIKEYEDRVFPPVPLTDADLLASLLAEKGITQTQLAAQAGIADSTISAILKGTRRIGKGHIAALCRIFKVSPVVFFRD